MSGGDLHAPAHRPLFNPGSVEGRRKITSPGGGGGGGGVGSPTVTAVGTLVSTAVTNMVRLAHDGTVVWGATHQRLTGFDISDPANVAITASITDANNLRNGGSTVYTNGHVFTSGNRNSSPFNETLSAWDVSNPNDPRFVKILNVSTFNTTTGVRRLAVIGSTLYYPTPSITNGQVTAVDISDPANMRVIGNLMDPNLWFASRLFAYGSVLLAVGGTNSIHRITAIDVSSGMSVISSLLFATTEANVGPGELVGSHFYVDRYTAGTLLVIDVSDPSNMSIVGSLGGFPQPVTLAIGSPSPVAYVFARGLSQSIVPVSVNDPTQPTVVGTPLQSAYSTSMGGTQTLRIGNVLVAADGPASTLRTFVVEDGRDTVIPWGGTPGQGLVKITAADGDAMWADVDCGFTPIPFDWGTPPVLFDTRNHDGSSSTLVNEGYLGSVWDLGVTNNGSIWFARKRLNWGSTPVTDPGTFPTGWETLIGGRPSTGVVVSVAMTPSGYDGSQFSEVEFISDSGGASNRINYYHTFFPSDTWDWFEVDTFAFDVGGLWSGDSFPLAYNPANRMWGHIIDAANRRQALFQYNGTTLWYHEHAFVSDGYVSPNDYVDLWDNSASRGGVTNIEATRTTINKMFLYVGEQPGPLPGLGIPWNITMTGIYRPNGWPDQDAIHELWTRFSA